MNVRVAPRESRLATAGVARNGPWLVAAAAALWGTDALLRQPLTEGLAAVTIVAVEHMILVLVTLPALPAALREARRLTTAQRLALLVIGAGASAGATALFTAAFAYGDPVTPLVLQKLQPLIVIAAALVLLQERPGRRYPLCLALALAGAWLISFPNPLAATASAAEPALLAAGAATLWAAGTVLGRWLSRSLTYRSLTVLRFAVGLPASLVLVAMAGAAFVPPASDLPALTLLALVPGLLAILLYYRGLSRTPASQATIAELAFPVTALLIGVALLGARPTLTQVLGVAMVSGAVLLLQWTSVRTPGT